ncbi:methyltransferase domain-containing protein [Flavobacterium sp. D11R37]|uniref:methyltransferase n=1 Tax=Flavobacterium coralii TaxID=2838017 RepID=UPI001CA7B211|nr:methyltransferase [Flavobacterium coralii]MBY8962760.1 methyltransferase domain-containing protein [Flavobacterium coralii]
MNFDSNYWEERYKNNQTGWDAGSVTTPIKHYIDNLTDKNLKILVPGAGNGHEFEYLLQQGFNNSYVIDIASTPLQNIKARLPEVPDSHIIHGDFFDHAGEYDLIIEQTFFCALNPALRKQYAEKMYSLLKPGGRLAGLLFSFPLTEQGPPFGGSVEEYEAIFSPHFTINKMEEAYNSIKPRAGKELFFIFEKK